MVLPDVAAVRRLNGADWAILRDLRLEALSDSPKAFLGRPSEEAARRPQDWRTMAERGVWFGAFIDETPAGLASVVYDVPTGDRYAESMWVLPRFRGRGVIGVLLGVVERYAGSQGGSVLRLWVLDGNHSAAAAYVRNGFRPTGLKQPVPGYPGAIEEEFIIDLPRRPGEGGQSRTLGTTVDPPVVDSGSFTARRTSLWMP
jgi:GNAT superfamily N-acetyltransferase